MGTTRGGSPEQVPSPKGTVAYREACWALFLVGRGRPLPAPLWFQDLLIPVFGVAPLLAIVYASEAAPAISGTAIRIGAIRIGAASLFGRSREAVASAALISNPSGEAL